MNEIAILQITLLLKSIDRTLIRLLQLQDPSMTVKFVEFYQIINGVKRKVVDMFPLADDVLDVAVAFKAKMKDGSLQPAKIDVSQGPPKWALTNPALGTLTVADDGLTAVFTGSGKVGEKGDIEVLADADLGDGVEEIKGILPLELIAPKASVVELSATTRP